jgi:TATA-box binding protein (TBP) (component of TFIID and TFIIIB)
MLLFIEGYPYELDYKIREDLTVRDALSGVVSYFNKKETTYKPEYVGYCYSKSAEDVVIFLPKVVLTGEQNKDNVSDTILAQTLRRSSTLSPRNLRNTSQKTIR